MFSTPFCELGEYRHARRTVAGTFRQKGCANTSESVQNGEFAVHDSDRLPVVMGGIDELLTVAETASATRHKPSTIRSWILHRRIPYVKLSRRVFIRKADIEALINRSIVPAADREVRP
jgi:excisionase family DNA binding protein